jgi:leishmanolysin-like peptidase
MTSDDHPHQVHELLHALGFSTDSWALFRHEDGTPRTPRGADGLPALTPTLCTDGVTRTVRAPSASTLLVRQERGVIVNRMVTPKVVAVARDLLGCSTLEGPELENQPTTSGSCFGSHWEQRLFPQEMMASTASHNSFISALTLAALEDSGWCAPPPHAEGVSLLLSPMTLLIASPL